MKKRISITALAIVLAMSSLLAQGKPDRVKGYKDKAKTHKTIALLPYQFLKKEYKSLPDGITEETLKEGEKEKGGELHQQLYAELSKKSHKHGHEWVSIETITSKLSDSGYDITGLDEKDIPKFIEVLGVDAVIFTRVETAKLVLPASKGSEKMWKSDDQLASISGSNTYMNMKIHAKGDEEPYWKWRFKLNGNFKNTKLMHNIVEKNYLHDHFPYKY